MRSDVHEREHALIERGSVIAARAVAIGMAPVFMIAGLGMSVSIVLLPFGVLFGVSGVLLLVWGLFGYDDGDAIRPVKSVVPGSRAISLRTPAPSAPRTS